MSHGDMLHYGAAIPEQYRQKLVAQDVRYLAQKLADEIRPDYLDVRVLEDGSIACLLQLFTTRSIVLGVTREGWEKRYCFADQALADQRFLELRTEDDEPQGWTARRPKLPGD